MSEPLYRDSWVARLESLNPTTAALPASLEASVLAIVSRIGGVEGRAGEEHEEEGPQDVESPHATYLPGTRA